MMDMFICAIRMNVSVLTLSAEFDSLFTEQALSNRNTLRHSAFKANIKMGLLTRMLFLVLFSHFN